MYFKYAIQTGITRSKTIIEHVCSSMNLQYTAQILYSLVENRLAMLVIIMVLGLRYAITTFSSYGDAQIKIRIYASNHNYDEN